MSLALLESSYVFMELRTESLIMGWLGLVIFITDLIDLYSKYHKETHNIPNDSGSNTEEVWKMNSFLGICVTGILINAVLIYVAVKNMELILRPSMDNVTGFSVILMFSRCLIEDFFQLHSAN